MVELGRLFRETGDIPWVVDSLGGKTHCVDDADARDYREFTSADPKGKKCYVTCVNTLVEPLSSITCMTSS